MGMSAPTEDGSVSDTAVKGDVGAFRPRHGLLVRVGSVGAVSGIALAWWGIPWPDAAMLVCLLVLLPVLSVMQARALVDLEIERIPAYVSSLASLLVLGAVAWAMGVRGAREGAFLGLVSLSPGAFVAWTVVLVVAGLVTTGAFRWLGYRSGFRETPLLRALLPGSARERAWFGLLSVSAGIGEELAYRGYVIGTLTLVMSPVAAAAVSSVVFGVLHVYQGPLGMMRTASLGALLAWGLLGSGSLWPAVAAHALLDVILGVVLGERMMVPEHRSGVTG
jgi:membrane protease YdiL (CAAX protease family)